MTVHHGSVSAIAAAWAGDVGTYTVGTNLPTLASAGTPSYITTSNIAAHTFSGAEYSTAARTSLEVSGDATFHGDIIIDGQKLSDTLGNIESRLAILRPNEQLEEKWDKLHELRMAYVELEREIIEKEKMWSKLTTKTTPSL